MVINDRIYGAVTITSPAIIDLLASKPVQRLKGICQYGVPDEYYGQKNFSRYEHSVGVMLLLKKLGASQEEQIAGLLHDVSHTAFSHVIDWIVGEGGQESYQDDQHEQYIANTDIPAILKKHGYATERITDYHHFGLLERDAPDLCADRVDYSLREFPAEIAQECVPALRAAHNRIVFANKHAATLFAEHFLHLQTHHWGGFEAASRYRLFADAMRLAISDGTVSLDDFWQNDDFVMQKVLQSPNLKVHAILQTLKNASLAKLQKSNVVVRKKFRYVDPHFMHNNELSRLQAESPDYARMLSHASQANQAGIVVPIVPQA